MALFKRIFLFVFLNLCVITTVSILLSVFHVQPYLTAHGLNIPSLMVFCLIWGLAGSFISLALSKQMVKWMLGVKIVNDKTTDPKIQTLIETIKHLAKTAKLKEIPEIGIYESSEINAFATGPSKKRSLIAVSSALLQTMSQKELEGVLGHEITHITNGDMVTMTLLQGVVNAFVMFLSRVLAYVLSGMGKNRSSSSYSYSYPIFVFVFQIVFMVLGWFIIAAYSRSREFRADKGGAILAGKEKMISALQALKKTERFQDTKNQQPALQTMKISNSTRQGLGQLFASHPPLEVRIQRLKEQKL
jgi:heat shock protein HtpX